MAEFDDDGGTRTVQRPSTLQVRRARLQVTRGPDAGRSIDFETRARVGAGKFADLTLTDPTVSSLHCEVVLGADVRLRDLGSKNGTLVGGTRIIEALLRATVGEPRRGLSASAMNRGLAPSPRRRLDHTLRLRLPGGIGGTGEGTSPGSSGASSPPARSRANTTARLTCWSNSRGSSPR
jgi:hypothetical protein